MQATPRKMKVAFYGSLLAVVIFGLLFVRNAFTGNYIWSLVFLGWMFTSLSTAANPGFLFLNLSAPALQQSTLGVARYCDRLSWLSYAGALAIWLTGKL